jgi:ankyrin repeat protein
MSLSQKQQEIMDKLLIEAAKNSDLGRMRTYAEKGADIHVKLTVSEAITKGGNTWTSSGTAPLYHLLCGDKFRTDISDFMLGQGVDVDVKNFNGNTPLMLAVKNLDAAKVKYFLSKGADPFATNTGGEVVLDEAYKLPAGYAARQEIIDMLVAAMANLATKPAAPAAKADSPVETTRDIKAMRPIELGQRGKGGGGLNL